MVAKATAPRRENAPTAHSFLRVHGAGATTVSVRLRPDGKADAAVTEEHTEGEKI